MLNLRQFYILGLPIETPIGMCHFVQVKDFPDLCNYLNILSTSRLKIIYGYQKLNIKPETLGFVKTLPLFEMVRHAPDIKKAYTNLFTFIFKDENAFIRIQDAETFDYIRQLIMDMNCVKEEKINPNPEIQAWVDKSKRLKAQEDGGMEFDDIVSSVATYNGLGYTSVNEMTIYQLYATFHRIASFKNYDTNTLFATVSTEKTDIESWCKHIDMFIEEKNGLSREEYEKMKKGIF